jgi:D-alanine-D-alanine ligase-like ATP-grasp enzyme
MVGDMCVSEIPPEMPQNRVLEIISMAQIAIKYREAYENGEYIPDDLTDEIFDKIKENKKAWDEAVLHPKDFQ